MKIITIFNIGTVLLAAVFAYSCAVGKLQCSDYVINSLYERKIYLPKTSANGLDFHMRASQQWRLIKRTPKGKLDHQSAFTAAKSGLTVICAYNTGSSKSGHVAVVDGKKQMFWSDKYKASVPYVSGSVEGRKPVTEPLSYQFSADKEPKMSYYVYLNNN
ncbi:MAG: hypothetical protein LBQ47_09050 [Endomicrobium sp.]|jgi:hypothetical protein|nr:hypothetical protein [Endomicrobium sp.]